MLVCAHTSVASQPALHTCSSSRNNSAEPLHLSAHHAGTPLPNNPQLRLFDWTATFVPGAILDGGMGGVFTAADGALLPDSGSLLADSSPGGASSSSGGKGQAAAAAVEDLQRVMRGQDTSQLRALVGLAPLPSTAGGSGSSDGEEAHEGEDAAAASTAEAEDSTMMGVRQYEPEAGELVVLLSARISGKPALGAELLVVARGEDGAVTLQLPDGWEQALAMA